jgi:UDP-N-acetylglucosamine acyltransferase
MKIKFTIPFFNPNKKIIIGKNNIISKNAIINDNVTIGNYNKIGDGVIINPNSKIGDNNTIFPRNIIGEYPCSTTHASEGYENIKNFDGIEIGNNNFFHIGNIISSGIENKTKIGNNNRFLGETFIHHDVLIENNVTFYPRSMTGGYCKHLSFSNVGMAAIINQRTVVGHYSMIGSNNTISKHVFPYFININNKIRRINKMKTPPEIDNYTQILIKINENFLNGNYNIDTYKLSENIKLELKHFYEYILKT